MKKIVLLVSAILMVCSVSAQESSEDINVKKAPIQKYQRSSIYTVLIKHSETKQDSTISSVFLSLPTPDKFNNHDLSIKTIESSAQKAKKKQSTKRDEVNMADIETFIKENDIPRQMVAKWFNRDHDGNMDINLLSERGFYNAQLSDIVEAQNNAYGIMSLGDQGEKLIGKTFLLVNDITYADRGERSAKAATGLRIFGALAEAVTGVDVTDTADAIAAGVNEIDGFGVNITSYLFQLEWNQDILNTLYSDLWLDKSITDQDIRQNRIQAFNLSDIFSLTYLGSTSATKGLTTSKSFSKKSEDLQMAIACGRALDESIVKLQREFDQFKVNVPILSINSDEKTCEVAIGLKEGINEESKFEVLMQVEDEEGNISYDRIGTIEPIPGQIWDNRMGALEIAEAYAADGEKVKQDEDSAEGNAYLKATTFKITTGADRIYPGCLVQEIKIKNVNKRK
jgi:hypothetical protein